jgi:WD40 repeat protein
MDSHIKIWDVQKGALQKTIEAFPVETWGVAWSIDGIHAPALSVCCAKVAPGKFLASTSKSGNVNIWNAESSTREQVLEPGQKFCMSVAFVCVLFSTCVL